MCEEEGTTHVHEVVWTALIVHAHACICMYVYLCVMYICVAPTISDCMCIRLSCYQNVTRLYAHDMTPLDHTQWKCLSDASHVLCGEFHDSV